ncbi:MAG: isochorismatase family protein [Cyanobacteria bacterium SIG30]|nr:isochorismatase family protein [Cyanobacteria bacterium SIG30]
MLNVDNALVLMIDVQEKLVSATNAFDEAINAEKIIHGAKILNIPVVVTEQYPSGLGQTVENVAQHFSSNVKMFEKRTFSAVGEENIFSCVEQYGKKQIILFGIELHICVLQTALELLDKGYEVFVVQNASKSRKILDFEIGLNLLKTKGVKILSLEILLFDLLKTSKHPNFKEVQALIK